MVWSWRVKSLSKRKDSLAFQLFSYMSTVIISIVILQAVAEQALIKIMLKVPLEVKQDIQSLAHQANVLIEDGDMDELADWANAQPYYLFVLDPENKPLSHRQMHPHFEFKLRFLREIDELLEDRVNKPLIGVRLDKGNTLVVQLPSQLHPAHRFIIFFSVSKFIIVIAILLLFSLIFARKLQMPLDRLREASRRLASGDFKVKVVKELRSNTREFNDLAHDFDNMTKEIHALAERQRRLIRDVSHELRTPLARQNLALHLLRSKAADSELPLVERLEKEVDEMDSLVGEILEFSRLENSRYEADSTPVCLESLISTQVEQSRLQLKVGQSLSISTGSTIPVVMTDERLVVRCITNLLSNSMKYAGEDAHIEVSIYELDEQPYKSVCIEVADNGPGIAQAQLEEIFRPFTRLESARDKQSGGYGLGLAIVKEAMKLLGGEVKASNRKESGLRVQLILPI
ncbi:histidine kinase sensor domain-containing protein [Vibrio tubiashii]|uniref:histidine kinase sensor domain-containing protein n=1 Tax=Vibrio tubiashii TaxID=29498 RepID=UPI001EFE0547|nr:histidine kinase sensor domain-containing protein [Vibrio tubiashii]MCG9582449.1 histidine kinase sensor domain-containing protein [Vibrio tubiashii]MCG9616040.1 histidine kinase sensor domain-containing protein [Vibrio tubiashii]